MFAVAALTAQARASGTSTVPQGINAGSIPGAQPFGNTPPDTPEQVSFIMRERNLSQLEAQAQSGFSRFLSVGEFADTYGQTPQALSALTGYLAGFGIQTTVYPDRVDVSATGTAGEFDQALSVSQQQWHVPEVRGRDGERSIPAQTIHGTKQSPSLPGPIAQTVLAVLGLTNYGSATSQAVHAGSSLAKPQPGNADGCLALTGLPSACHLPSDFASNYGLGPLYGRGAEGQGQTIAIVTLAALDVGAPEYFWKHIAHTASSNRSVTVDNIDGGPGAPSDTSGTFETDLDVEQSGGLAPDSNVIVYQAPNSDVGFADAFFTAASQNIASTVSSSWLNDETVTAAAVASGDETPAFSAAFDEAFLEMAAQGQSGFAVSGDWGAYPASFFIGTTNLSIGQPGDSPYITAAGGTTLPWSETFSGPGGTATVNVPAQRIWGWDYLWQPVATLTPEPLTTSAESQVTGSGGGFSDVEPQPAYQRGVSGTSAFSAIPYLTPTDYQNVDGILEPTAWDFDPTPSVIFGRGSGRADPDLSADADPLTGYLAYEPSAAAVGQPTLQGGWGGTSFVAPQFNGSTAVMDSYLGHRIGFWNPGLYAFATSDNSPVTPLNAQGTSNDNLFYTGTPGTTFNEGAGLGIPNLAKLADDFGSER
jgi:subtilase family serine protease